MTAASKLPVLLAVLLAPALAPAAEPAAQTITVRPAMLRLAEGGRAVVRVVGAREPPVVSASIGRVEGLREIGSGVFEAQYIPPDTLDPHVVLITAASPSGFAWTSLDLAGVREVVLRGRHRELLSASVAGQTYGPVPADASGKAVLRVDVPPGARVATSGARSIDLDVPRRSFAHVALGRATLEAIAAETVAVRVVAVDERGEPLSKPQVKLTATDGEVSAVRQVSRGVVAAQWNVGRGGLRESKLTAQVASRPPVSASATLRRVAGAPHSVTVAVDRERLVAGESDELLVTARVVDSAGNPTDAPARLFVSLGTGAGARLLPNAVVDWQEEGGVYTGRVAVPRQRTGQLLEVKVIGPGGLVGTRAVTLLPGRASAVRVEPEETLYADGRERQLRVVLLDEHGNRAEAEGSAVVTATRGTVGTPTRFAPGIYVVDYRSSLSAQDYDDVITARIGPVEGRGEFRVRARGGTVVLGLKGGYTVGSGSLSSPGGALEVGVWSPSFRHGLGVVLDVRYFGYGQDETLSAGTVSLPVSADASFLAFEPSLAWRRPMLSGMLWLGAGPGIVRAASSVSAPGQPDLSSTSWVPSAHASASWGLPLGPGIPFAELKGAWQAEADEAPVRGSLSTLTLNVGYRFDVL